MMRNLSNLKKSLTPKNRKDLSEWLETLNLDINNIHRTCSDCVVIAKLLKKLFPKMVDLYAYPQRNTMKLKVENWQKLTSQVLNKLKLPQKPADLQKYVIGDKDAITSLLYSIMLTYQESRDEKKDGAGDEAVNDIDLYQQVMVNIERVVDGEAIHIDQKMINYQAYEATRQNIRNLDEAIKKASAKVNDLEKLAVGKSEKIDELLLTLAKQTVKSMEKENQNKNGMDPDKEIDEKEMETPANGGDNEAEEDQIENEITQTLMS